MLIHNLPFCQCKYKLTASAKEAAALEGGGEVDVGRGGALGAGVGAPEPGLAGTTGLLIELGLAGITGLGPGTGGARRAAGTGAPPEDEVGRGAGVGTLLPPPPAAAAALRASSCAFHGGTPLLLGGAAIPGITETGVVAGGEMLVR